MTSPWTRRPGSVNLKGHVVGEVVEVESGIYEMPAHLILIDGSPSTVVDTVTIRYRDRRSDIQHRRVGEWFAAYDALEVSPGVYDASLITPTAFVPLRERGADG